MSILGRLSLLHKQLIFIGFVVVGLSAGIHLAAEHHLGQGLDEEALQAMAEDVALLEYHLQTRLDALQGLAGLTAGVINIVPAPVCLMAPDLTMRFMNAAALQVARNSSDAARGAEDSRSRAQDGAKVVGQVAASMGRVDVQARELKEHMRSLGQRAEAIGRIMDVISDIADQTNLLALNAAIEARRAGASPWWPTKCASWPRRP